MDDLLDCLQGYVISKEDDPGFQTASALWTRRHHESIYSGLRNVHISIRSEHVGHCGHEGGIEAIENVLEVMSRNGVVAGEADYSVSIPMDLYELLTSCFVVQAIHVLRHNPQNPSLPFESRQCVVDSIGFYAGKPRPADVIPSPVPLPHFCVFHKVRMLNWAAIAACIETYSLWSIVWDSWKIIYN